MTIKELADLLEGTVVGDAAAALTGVAGIRDAGPGDVTFLASGKFLRDLKESRASCAIVKEPVEGLSIPQIIAGNPYRAFARTISIFYPKPSPKPVAGMAAVSAKAKLGNNVTIYPFVYVADGAEIGDDTVLFPGVYIGDNASVGKGCILHPNVTIREDCIVGNGVIIHAGTVIGSDGFGYVFDMGEHHKIPQVGKVVIEDSVEIGSNVSIDRATLGETRIGRGTKVDNLVQIAHNVSVGEHSILVSQVGISGSCRLGSHVTLAGQVGIADHTSIESGTIIGAKSGVMGGEVSKGVYIGAPIAPHREFMKAQTFFLKLPEMNRRIKELEEKLSNIAKEKE